MSQAEAIQEAQIQQQAVDPVAVEKRALYFLLNAVVKNQLPQSYVGSGRVVILKELFGLETFPECEKKWQEILAYCTENVH